MKNFEILFYSKDDGTEPAEAFILGLETKWRARILLSVALLADNGYFLREPYSKSLKDGIFELRVKADTGISLVLYFFFVGHKIILTNGFIKKKACKGASELKLAEKCRAEFLSKKENQL